jgi:hypothetical protein
MRRALQWISGFFPIKLLLLHVRRSLLTMFFWLVLFGLTGGFFLGEMGFRYLFNTPEYLERVSWLSYLIMGVTVGLFVMAFHISTYIFYSYRFPFLAALNRPIYCYSINNSVIPIAFYGYYLLQIIQVQRGEGVPWSALTVQILALLLGSVITISLVFTYFFSTLRGLKVPIKKEVRDQLEKPLDLIIKKDREIKQDRLVDTAEVHSYLKNFLSIRNTRKVSHYDDEVLLSTLQKHHKSAAWFFLLILFLLWGLGRLSDRELFQIPAGGSIVLLMTLYLLVAGALYSRFKTWSVAVGLLLVIGINYIVGTPWLYRPNHAFGMNYQVPPAHYNHATLNVLTTDSIQTFDKNEMLIVLENWKARQPRGEKPRMILINSSGGGLRSSVWTFGIMQSLDSISNGRFLEQTFAIFGSSGGMIGAAYFRELKLLSELGADEHPLDPKHRDLIGRDLLNPVALKFTLNDLLFQTRTFQEQGQRYRADRGHAFEIQLNKNLGQVFQKRLIDYREAEQSAKIPMLVMTPTLVKDGRRLLASPLGLSFLTRNQTPYTQAPSYEIDGVELRRFFEKQGGDSIRFSTVLRMSATFPYITPLVSLPSVPELQVIDAGARDNEGFALTLNFLYHFKDWIAANTSGVTVIRIKANRADEIQVSATGNPTLFDNLQRPIFGVVNSYANFQYYTKFSMLHKAHEWMDFELDFQTYSLLTLGNEVSLSWHLTRNERRKIAAELGTERIRQALRRWESDAPPHPLPLRGATDH